MKNKLSLTLLSLLGVSILTLLSTNINKVSASNNEAMDWKLTYTTNTKYTKIRKDTSDNNGVCFEGITLDNLADRYNESAAISYYKPVTIARTSTVKLDGLRFSFAIRNASEGTGDSSGSYDFGDFAGFFFATTARAFSNRHTGDGIKNVMFTLFCKPYPSATQSRFCMSVGQASQGSTVYHNYPCMDCVAVQHSKPDTTSIPNWSSASSVVFDNNAYQMSGKTYYNAGLDFGIDSYDATWYKITIGQYAKINNRLWNQNANYDSNKKTATFYLEKSYLSPFINSSGATVLHVYGSGTTTFAYVYNVYNVNQGVEEEVKDFVSYLYMSENTTGQCYKYFASARSKFLSLSNDAQTLFKTSSSYSNQRARYEAWGRSLNQDPYKEAQSSNFLSFVKENEGAILITLSLTVLVGSFFVVYCSKKKRLNH